MSVLVFQHHPEIMIASNLFVNVHKIIQYEDVPLIEVVKEVQAGYEIQIPIYHNDGTYLAKVKGSRIFPTKEGVKAGVTLRHPDKMSICEMKGKTIFEIRREEAAALKTNAELYTNDGSFIQCSNEKMAGYVIQKSDKLQIGSITMVRCTIANKQIGIHIHKDGSITI